MADVTNSETVDAVPEVEFGERSQNADTRIRIAVVTQGFHIGGGVPAVSRWIRKGLDADGRFDVDVFDLATRWSDEFSRCLLQPRTWFRRSLRGRVHGHESAWGANAVELEFMRYMPRLELSRQLASYDLIQVVGGSPALAFAVLRSGVPVVVQAATTAKWERGSRFGSMPLRRRLWSKFMTVIVARIEVATLRRVDAVVVENRAMQAHAERVGAIDVNFAPPGVNIDRFSPSTEGLCRSGYLLSVCRLGEPRKGLDRLIRAYKKLLTIRPDAPPLILAGKGELSPAVVSLIEEFDLESRVQIRADVDPADLPELYRGASTFLQTSHEEGLGISVIEAMASGLPVIATETAGSQVTVRPGITGWIISQRHEEELLDRFAQLIVQVLENDGPGFAINARDVALSEFSSDAALARFLTVYRHILNAADLRL